MDDPAPAALLDHAVDKVAVLDASGTFTYVNAAAKRILGYEPAELVGESAFEYVHAEDRERVRGQFRTVVAAAESAVERSETYRFRAADGSWVHLESRISTLTGEAVGGYVISSRDVTDRVTAERERTATARRLDLIAAKTEEVLWMFDADWSELLFVNGAVEHIYGVDPEALRAAPRLFLETVHPEDRGAVEREMARLSSGESAELEYRVNPEGPSGTSSYDRWVLAQGEPVVDDGEVTAIVGFSRDVTDRRERERQLAVMDTLLRHNIRNHVNLVEGNAEAVLEAAAAGELVDTDVEARCAEILDAARDLLSTAEKQREVIGLLRGEAVTRPVGLAAVVADAAARVRKRYPGATVETDVPDGLTVAVVDQFELAVEELLENALEYATTEPRVTVVASAADGTVTLSVRDRGPPIPESEYAVWRGDAELTAVQHASGLGLWLVYWAVERSGGHVEVGRIDAGGNEVRVTLERATPAAVEGGPAAADPP